MPPAVYADPLNSLFSPAPEVLAWARSEILTDGGQLYNEEHSHLEYCDVQFLWAPHGFNKAGRTVLGLCEEVVFRCNAWQKGRQQQQMADWFGTVPQYLITLDASYCLTCSDAEFCVLVEHELMHISQELDEFGSPKFTKDGFPKLMLRSHDVEEFVGVVARYGATAEVQRLVDAVAAGPTVAAAAISRACGTCNRG